MTPEEIKKLIEDLANNVVDQKKAVTELVARFADKGDLGNLKALPAAVKQLEDQYAAINADVQKKIDKVRRQSWDSKGNYRGVFASEDDARQFGLLMLAKSGGFDADCKALADNAVETLKRDYPDLHKRAMDSTTDGALITPEFSSRLVRLIEQFGVFESNAFVMPMGSSDLTFLRRTGGMTVFLVGENTAGTASQPTHGNVTLNAKEWGTLTYVPRTLEEDSAAMIGEIIAFEIAQAMAEKTDECGFNGDGSATYFGVVGVRARLTTVNGVDEGGGLVLGAGNLHSELTLADHDRLMGILPQYAANNAAFYCSRTYFFNTMVRLMHAQGGVTAGEIQGRRQLMFGGDPVHITQVMPRSDAVSQVSCLYGDLRAAATIGRRRGLTIETSRDYQFAARQITYLGTQRKAITVNDVGSATVAGPIVGLITASS